MKIRKAEKEDYNSVIELIKELAVFEKAGDKVTNTAEQMIKEQNHFNCLVAESDNGEIIGFAIFFFAYFTWVGKSLYLDDIYIKPDFRNKGIGKDLLREIFKVAVSENCKRVRWQVLDWNTDAIEFYKKIKANFDNEWINCDFNAEEILKFKI